MNKVQVADVLVKIATPLDLKGEIPFKSRAYQNAARALENMAEPLDKLIADVRQVSPAAAARFFSLRSQYQATQTLIS